MTDVFNPATGEAFTSLYDASLADVDRAVTKAEEAFASWETAAASSRAVILVSAAAKIRANADTLAALLTREQGKPLREAKDEIQGAAHVFEYYASVCGSIPGDARFLPKYGYLNVVRKPIGVCGAVVPWNMPAIIFAWKAGAALACGNAVLVKPSVTASLTVAALAGALHEAGVPADILQVITGPGVSTGAAIVSHPRIRHISFTGSPAAGRAVSLAAAPHLKKLTLELGGNDAFIVTRSADLGKAAAAAVRHRFYNCGQVCTSAKRILVHEELADAFVRLAKERIEKLTVGDGAKGSSLGPLNSAEQRSLVEAAVNRILDHGKGDLVTGGERLKSPGYFYRPTLLSHVEPSAVSEEIFGPVMPVISFSTDEGALKIANSTPYGLGASVWTNDLAQAREYAGGLRAGVVWVNKHLILPPEMPFGGVAGSGFGRENGQEFIYEYTEPKSILFG
ncbi:MAG: aldehyde dehydrogenase family protein [Methanocorpusculum sp.]|nr:aldehyde dehydrogenase family protein [Methanocorpusculum sp.]